MIKSVSAAAIPGGKRDIKTTFLMDDGTEIQKEREAAEHFDDDPIEGEDKEESIKRCRRRTTRDLKTGQTIEDAWITDGVVHEVVNLSHEPKRRRGTKGAVIKQNPEEDSDGRDCAAVTDDEDENL